MADQSSGATYFPQMGLLPDYLQQLVKSIGGEARSAGKQYGDFISNPTANPLFTNQLSGILNNPTMLNARRMSQQNLGDAFRDAGNMSSGIYGNSVANQNTGFLQQDQTLASQLLGQMFPQMASALMQPQSLATQLMSALKLQQQYGAPQAPQVYGGGGGGGSSDFLSQYRANGAGNPYDPFSGANFSLGGASSGVNAQPTQSYAGPDYNTLSNPYYNAGTILFPNGDYVSSSSDWLNDSAGSYNPSASWENLYGGNNGLIGYGQGYDQYGNADAISGEY